VVLGYQGLVEFMVARIRSDLKTDAIAIATGGFSSVLEKATGIFDAVDSSLTLRGLKLIIDMIN
jgi:type III pantothenate kinase